MTFELRDIVVVPRGSRPHYRRIRRGTGSALSDPFPSAVPTGEPLVVARVYPDGDLGLQRDDGYGWWTVSPEYVRRYVPPIGYPSPIPDDDKGLELEFEVALESDGRLHPDDLEAIARRVAELLGDGE